MQRASTFAAILLCSASCRKSAPSPAPAAAQPAPPAAASSPAAARFCEQDLSGVWINASDPHFAYRFRDHGDLIRGEFQERADDGTLKNPDEAVTLELHRTATALAGVMRSRQQTRGGRDCPVEFGIDVTTCGAARLQATVEPEASITEECKRKTAEDGGDLPTSRTEYVFVRDALHPSGGGGPRDAH